MNLFIFTLPRGASKGEECENKNLSQFFRDRDGKGQWGRVNHPGSRREGLMIVWPDCMIISFVSIGN